MTVEQLIEILSKLDQSLTVSVYRPRDHTFQNIEAVEKEAVVDLGPYGFSWPDNDGGEDTSIISIFPSDETQ